MENFNETIRDHLTKQKARASDRSQCVYRGDKGNKCAIGCLIPDDKYFVDVEGLTVARAYDLHRRGHDGASPETLKRMTLLLETVPPEHFSAAVMWQDYHDTATRTGDNVLFSYAAWIDGDEAQSPAAFHDAMIATLAAKAEKWGTQA